MKAVSTEQLALVQGWGHTKATLRDWNARPSKVLVPWTRWSLAVALLLLLATYLVAKAAPVDPTEMIGFPGVFRPTDLEDYAFVLFRNSLVLLLHALACVAGFIAGSSLPVIAEGYSGWYRKLHEVAQPLAIAFVVAATLFSLATQAYYLGGTAATMASTYGVGPGELLAVLSIHALPELTALFLPLAAWTIASREGKWEDLLAATFATTAFAVPVLLVAGAIETWVTPTVLRSVVF